MSRSRKIDIPPFTEGDAFRVAQRDIWSRVGSFCYPAFPKTAPESAVTEFQVWADIPRIYSNPLTGQPEDTHFFRFKDIGKVQVSLYRGSLVASVTWMEAKRALRERMDEVDMSVEKALLKTSASAFSELPLAEHMHTPLLDILSALIFERQIDLAYWSERMPTDEEGTKLSVYVSSLETAQLARKEGHHVYPGNVFLALQDRGLDPAQLLRASLRAFFESGIDQIESIRRVIGPQLRIASRVYEAGLEWGQDKGLTRDEITAFISREAYPSDSRKELQVPRYIVQLEAIGLIRGVRSGGAETFQGMPGTYKEVLGLRRILAPFQRALTPQQLVTPSPRGRRASAG